MVTSGILMKGTLKGDKIPIRAVMAILMVIRETSLITGKGTMGVEVEVVAMGTEEVASFLVEGAVGL
jgi:hypothetical protein